ncbi:MAG TPA: antitoxin [Thermosulfidibacter takaii]|uniref:Antitoxin n=1 Tax=Thermosulfidibacter takaii TaxID=412593 RepID=A0A7C0Y940_9BACT|nr:antitoxin [Thermosulfidibacter takaii]
MARAKLFMNGRSQAVRLPKDFRFPGKEVIVKRVGSVVVLYPADDPWGPLKESLGMFSHDFMEERVQPQLEKREAF